NKGEDLPTSTISRTIHTRPRSTLHPSRVHATAHTPDPSPTFTLASWLRARDYNFSATRSFALRDRGFRFSSSSEAVNGLPVSAFTIAFAPHPHTGIPGGQTHSPSNRRNASFT